MTGFATEIYEQPDALHRLLNSFSVDALYPLAQKLQAETLKRVVFTGMGSSYHASAPAVLILQEHGIEARAVEASELLYYGKLDAQTLLIAISQSGRSVEVVKLIESLNQRDETIPIIGITNDPESTLALHSDTLLLLQAGVELTVSTKTYTNTLALLDLVARGLSGEPTQPALENLRTAADLIREALPGWAQQANEIAVRLADSRFVVFLGRGPSRASAMTAALITKESTKLPTEGMVGGQFRHGPLEVISPELATFIFAQPGRAAALNLTLARDLTQMPGHVCVIGGAEAVPGAMQIAVPKHAALNEWIAPILDIIPIQLIAARLAEQRGFDTNRFVRGSKVTTHE